MLTLMVESHFGRLTGRGGVPLALGWVLGAGLVVVVGVGVGVGAGLLLRALARV